MADEVTPYPPERLAESKVMPPPDPGIRFPEVAAIPPKGKSMVVIPKEPEIPARKDFPVRENGPEQEIPVHGK